MLKPKRRQSSGCIHINQMFSAFKEAGGSCFLEQEISADSGIYVISDHNNVL
jgi:hypothetical protein